jgi:hypothetical protein
MIRNNNLAEWIIASQNDTAAVLTLDHKSEFLQNGDADPARRGRKLVHTATTSASK